MGSRFPQALSSSALPASPNTGPSAEKATPDSAFDLPPRWATVSNRPNRINQHRDVARHLGVHSLPVVGYLPVACPVLGFYDPRFLAGLFGEADWPERGAMSDTVSTKNDLAVLEDYIQDLLADCREAMEEAEDCIARSKKAKEKSKALVTISRNLRTH